MKHSPRFSNVLNSLLEPIVGRLATGRGCILMFHRIVDDTRAQRIANTEGETPPQLLADTITLMRARGYELVDLETAIQRMRQPEKGRPFVVFTFDDGYREHAREALQILREREVPMTLYLCADFLSRRSTFWWYLLEDALLEQDVLELEGDHPGWPRRWEVSTLEAKRAAFRDISDLFGATHGPELGAVERALFGEAQVAALAHRLAMDWDDVMTVARDKGVTIASHTASHPVLNRLPQEAMEEELLRGRGELERHINRPVEHLAYPYGSRLQVGAREIEAAKRLRFKTATTTRVGHIFPQHGNHLQALPRLYILRPDLRDMRGMVGGVTPWLRHRGRPFVTT